MKVFSLGLLLSLIKVGHIRDSNKESLAICCDRDSLFVHLLRRIVEQSLDGERRFECYSSLRPHVLLVDVGHLAVDTKEHLQIVRRGGWNEAFYEDGSRHITCLHLFLHIHILFLVDLLQLILEFLYDTYVALGLLEQEGDAVVALLFAWDLLITRVTPDKRHRATLLNMYLHLRDHDALVTLRARLVHLGTRLLMLPEL